MAEPFAAGRDLFAAALFRRVFGGDSAELPIFFDIAVLDHYRGKDGFSLMRTDSAGRLKAQGGFSVDFGIAPAEDSIHLPLAALARLPEREHPHWLAHLVSLPLSRAFVQMRLHPGSCFDDGDARPM